MDACLYLRIQSLDDNEREHDHPETTIPSDTNVQQNDKNDNNKNNADNNTILTSSHKLPFMDKFSQIAFQGMSIKLMMTDPVDNYLMGPLSEAFASVIDFKHNLLFISANMVSYAGVVAAIIAAKLVTYDSTTLHRMSFVFFQLRTWLDDLDGVVARSRMGIYKHVSLSKTSGYVVDGVCDGIGFVAYIIGCYIFMKQTLVRQHRRRRRQQQLMASSADASERHNLQSITEVRTTNASYVPLEQKDLMIDYANNDNSNNNDNTNSNPMEAITDSEIDEVRELTTTSEDDDDDEIILHNSLSTNLTSFRDHRRPLVSSGEERIKVPRRFWARSSGHKSTSRIFFNRFRSRFNVVGGLAGKSGKYSTHLVFYRYFKEKIKHNLNSRRTVLLILCFLLQLAMCSTFWNRYILIYRDLLESASTGASQSRIKRKVLKSNIMYVIIWFWRLTNGHTFMQMLVGSVFFGKLWQFLECIKFIGFVEIIVLATITELHIMDVRNFLAN